MLEKANAPESRPRIRKFAVKVVKATIKAILFFTIYLVFWMLLAPVSELILDFQQAIEIFVIVYILMMFAGELTSGTILHHLLVAAKALFVMGYLIMSLKSGLLGINLQNIYLTVDFGLFLVVAMLLSLLEFVKSMFQAINYLSGRVQYFDV